MAFIRNTLRRKKLNDSYFMFKNDLIKHVYDTFVAPVEIEIFRYT